jgi:hypothetical protein
MIGHVLIYTPPGPDGLCLHRSAASAQNARDANDLRDGFILLNVANSVAAQNRADRIPDASATVTRAIPYHPAIRAAAARYSVESSHTLDKLLTLRRAFDRSLSRTRERAD